MTLTSSAHRMGDTAVLRVAGRIDLGELERWTDLLEVGLTLGSGPVLIDVADLLDWSISAQAALLGVARRAAAGGREVALCRPSARLRASSQLPVFERLTSYRVDAETAATRRPPRQRRAPARPAVIGKAGP